MCRRTLSSALVADMVQRADDAVQERLASDEAVVGPHRRLAGEMLARAEADLELQRTIAPNSRAASSGPVVGHRDARQQVLDQRRLAGAQLVPLAAAVELAMGSGSTIARA